MHQGGAAGGGVDGGDEGSHCGLGEVSNNCDDEVPEVMAADAVATVLLKNGVKTPKMASGLSEADINGLTGFLALPMDQKLMLKLSVSVAKATVTAKHGAEPRPPATPVSNMMGTQSAAQSSMAQVTGQEAPQRVVEAAMQEQPDLKLALNTKLSFESIPFYCQVDMSVFQAMKGESEMARKEGRKAFCYVELSSEQVSPIWMQMSLIGSRAGSLPGQDDAPEGDFMQVMARTMSQMTKRGRYFVNMTQWAAAFWQYVPVATAYKHFNLGGASAYFNMICAMPKRPE